MAKDHTIDITARIANLDKIRKELGALNVEVKFQQSKELKELLKLGQSGLTIDIKFKMPAEFKKLMDLQSKGLNINFGAGRTSGVTTSKASSGPTDFASTQRSVSTERANRVMAQEEVAFRQRSRMQGIQDRQNERDVADEQRNRRAQTDRELKARFENQAQQKKITLARQKSAEREARQLQKANEYVENAVLESIFREDVRGTASQKYGVDRSKITGKTNFFNPKRVFQKDNFKDILFTGLLGGPAQGIGAAAGVATFDRGGALIGANVAAATVAVFSKITEAMKSFVQAGSSYERTVTGITGIFQATSEVINKSGSPVDIRTALGFQRNRAQSIQDAAQRALLPLGISGDAASALTKSYTAGLAQRGISPDEKTSEIVLRRLGASIQTLQPELANDANALQRTVEDIIGGSPQAQRTELGAAIKGLAPGLFGGGAKTNEDIVKATDALEALVVAIKNNDTASVQWQRSLGALQLAQQEVGKGILEAVAPALKTLADELTKPETVAGLKELGTAIGQAAGDLINVLVPAIKGVSQAAKAGVQTPSGLVKAGFSAIGAVTGKDKETRVNNAGAALGGLGSLLTRRQINLTGADSNPLLSGDTPLINQGQAGGVASGLLGFINTRRKAAGLAPLGAQTQNLTTRQSLTSLLQSAKTNYGVESPDAFANSELKGSPENALFGLNKLRGNLSGYDKGRSAGDLALQGVGLNSQEIQIRRQIQEQRGDLFDKGDFGQLRRGGEDKESLQSQVKLAEENVTNRKKLLSFQLVSTDSNEESIAKARLAVQKAEEEVIKLRNETASKEQELIEKRLAIVEKQAQAQDKGTFAGRETALNIRSSGNIRAGVDLQISAANDRAILNDPKASPLAKSTAQDRLDTTGIVQTANLSEKADIGRQKQKEAFGRANFSFTRGLALEGSAISREGAGLQLKEVSMGFKELELEQSKLTRATKDASRALEDFSNSKELRALGRQGEEISAAESIVAAGGAVPAGVDPSLVRGSDSFDPEARQAFERKVAEAQFDQIGRKNSLIRVDEEERLAEQGLTDTVTGLGIDQEKSNLKPEELKLRQRGIVMGQRNAAYQDASDALTALQEDPNNPELQKQYQDAQARLDAVKSAQKSQAERVAPPGVTPVKGTGSGTINGIPIGSDITGSMGDFGTSIYPGFIGGVGKLPLIAAQGQVTKRAAIAEELFSALGDESSPGATASRFRNSNPTKRQLDIGGEVLKQFTDTREAEKGAKDVNGGASIFDKLSAMKPLTRDDMTSAFSAALQQNFV